MKAMTAIMILIFSLSFVGCATTQSGSGSTAGTSNVYSGATTKSGTTKSSGSMNGKMLTEEDYKRIGVKETGVR